MINWVIKLICENNLLEKGNGYTHVTNFLKKKIKYFVIFFRPYSNFFADYAGKISVISIKHITQVLTYLFLKSTSDDRMLTSLKSNIGS